MTQLGEYIKMALKNIWANKVRTFLTMLGIIIGISSVILIISVGGGATETITKELGELGKGQIAFMVIDYQDKYLITETDLDHIRAMKGVKAVTSQEFSMGSTKTRKDDFSVSLTQIGVDGFSFLDNEFIKGAPFTESDVKSGKRVCILTDKDAMRMFGSTNVVGLDFDVTLDGGTDMNFTICGVVKAEDDNAVSSMFEDPSVQLIIPSTAILMGLGLDISENIYWDFYILTEEDADAKTVCADIIDYLETAHHCKGKQVYDYSGFDDMMKQVNSVINMITIFVAFVASISLVVGGIGVMNIMLVSVTERTREIGIRKALGARTGSITVQFLAESAFITLIGGLIGILFGLMGAWGIAKIISALVPAMKFAPQLKISTVLTASLFSSAVGIFFGIYPARKAAKMSPIEALRRN